MKHHLLIREWVLACDAPQDVWFFWHGPQVEEPFIGGWRCTRDEQIVWIQWDTGANQLLIHLPQGGGILHTPNEFGGSFRVAEPEGRLEKRIGTTRLLESYDKQTTLLVRVGPLEVDG